MPYAYTNGIVTHYEDAGSGEPVVLIHGHSVDLRLWDYQVPALRHAGFRVIRYDVRGHGRSLVPSSGYDWRTYAADLNDLLDRLGVSAAHIVGHSMGGGVALQFALDFPQRALSLALIDSALPGFTYSEEFSRQIEGLVQAVRSEGPASAFERLWLSHPLFAGLRRFPDRFQFLREMVLAYPAADYREGALSPDLGPAVIDRLSQITVPALVMVGEQDIPDFQLIADLLAENLPAARPYGRPSGRKLVLPDCGHVPPLEQPAAVNQALLQFLRKHRPARR